MTAYLRTVNRWNPDKPGFNKDLLIYKNDLQIAVPDEALCIAGDDESHSIYFYYIHKKGWGFNKSLSQQQMSEMVRKGAQFLYSDSRTVDEDKEIIPYLEQACHRKRIPQGV